ncbi:uncharacterized protein N7484_001322, partial [Penicillium longicatenatum]|uniref:uncharacterized protein n=1 Tax=Penicillium longicatenatum TaxID=1561947 RepID=UPI002546824E
QSIFEALLNNFLAGHVLCRNRHFAIFLGNTHSSAISKSERSSPKDLGWAPLGQQKVSSQCLNSPLSTHHSLGRFFVPHDALTTCGKVNEHFQQPICSIYLAGLLSSCLRQLPNLKALNFSGPPLTSLLHDEMKASIDPILMVLCYVPLPNLTELEIMLPMTNNFAPLFAEKISTLRIPIEQTLSRLHHLGLHVYAQTNQQSYASHLLRIVELSTNLTSLSLSSPNFLSIDSLRLSPRVRLRYLFLQNVNISSQNMVDIIEQSIGSLTYIELRHLQIEPGSPREILPA